MGKKCFEHAPPHHESLATLLRNANRCSAFIFLSAQWMLHAGHPLLRQVAVPQTAQEILAERNGATAAISLKCLLL